MKIILFIMDKSLILNEIKNHLGFKKDSDFANFLGIKQNTLSTWKSRNVIDYDLIVAKCDNIDANWLLTGKGSMLKGEVKNEVVTPNNDKYVAMLEKNNALLEENKALLLAENERLKAEIQALKSVQSATVNQFDQPSQSKSLIQPLTQSTR